MSESTPAAAPPGSTDATAAATSSTTSAPTDTAASSSSSAPSSSSSASSSTSVALATGVSLIPAERNDFYVGAPIYVRQQQATVMLVDWPHVYWRTTAMADDQQKHRSFTDSRDMFSIDERDRGKKADRRDALPYSGNTHSALPGLLLSTGGGGGGLVDDDEDDDDDDDDDEEFTVAAVTAVLKPALAQKAIAVLEERRSPKHSPKNRQAHSQQADDSSGSNTGQSDGKSEESSQQVDSDS